MTRSGFALPEAETCYFCDQLSKTPIPGWVMETPLTVTLVNARQHQEGQVIVIPKRHAPTIFDLTHEEALEAMESAQRVAEAVKKAFSMDGMLLYQNNGVASGQEVPHFHVHVCPQRFSSSRWGNEPPHIADALNREFRPHPPRWLEVVEQAQVAERLRGALAQEA